jgi:Flp pilus assembly protein TadG
MRHLLRQIRADMRGTAAVEMALVMPVLLFIMFGVVELGNYFMNEHSLVKAVRDGARFAARQNFTNYTSCSGVPGGTVVTDTQNVVMNGYLSGGSVLTPNISASDIDLTTQCFTGAVGGQTMQGVYRGRANGAQIVTVTATVNYRPILAAFGFTGLGMSISATSQAAVAGI